MNERIRKLRRELDLTQREFADRIGIKRNTVATYETGRNIPIDAVVSLICRTFNVNENWLRNGEGDMFIVVDKELELMEWAGEVLREESSSFRHRFVAALSVLDEKDWKEIERLARKMTEALNEESK